MKDNINLQYNNPNTLDPESLDNIYTQEMKDIKEKAIADGTFMKAPNGHPSKLDERQWLTVRTKEFKEWFGDWERNVKPYNRRTSKQATVRLNKVTGEKYHVNPDKLSGIILTDTNGHSIFNAMNRTFILCNVNGNVIPYYQSSKGTSGKKKGNWYPFFGYTGNRLIKGDVNENGEMHYSPEIDRITTLLNEEFKIPTDFNNDGISESSGMNVKDLGLTMYSVYDRFKDEMKSFNITDANDMSFFDKELNETTNANALFVKEITGIKTKGIHQSHNNNLFIKPFIDSTTNDNSVSKVVDENGEPLIVYHGSDVQFDKFEFRSQVGFHFGTKEAALHRNASNVKSFFLNIKNLEEKEDILSWFGEPFTKELVRDGSLTEDQANNLVNNAMEHANSESEKNKTIPRIAFYVKYISEFTKNLKGGEYGIIYKNKVEDPGSVSYIAFSNDQIRLASPTTPNMEEVQNAARNGISNIF